MKYITPILLITLLLICCRGEKDTTFLITKDSVGKLSRMDLIADLETIYAEDSIVKDTPGLNLEAKVQKVKIFEKGGKHLLTLTPGEDSIPKVENVRIYDRRFVTEKGIGLGSTFRDIRDAYTIRKIVTSMNNVVIFIKDSDLYFTISKEELPSSLRYAASTNIEAVQIPDMAKLKYLMVGWE